MISVKLPKLYVYHIEVLVAEEVRVFVDVRLIFNIFEALMDI